MYWITYKSQIIYIPLSAFIVNFISEQGKLGFIINSISKIFPFVLISPNNIEE